MKHEFSEIGRRLAGGSGIGELMEDLGRAMMAGPAMRMLGGGQPARIPALEARWAERLRELLDEPEGLARMLTVYDPPQGKQGFREAVAGMLRERFGWAVGPEHVAVTAGGQTAFFFLFNLLAGRMPDGSRRRILLPLVPEYIGYACQGAGPGLFRAARPTLDEGGAHEFKYRVDFDALEVDDEVAALCCSRPTNPTGNVLEDAEVERLAAIARERGIPLILDNAYGAPFPNIIFNEARPIWDEHLILTMSLSKIGLPGARTGIVVAPPEIAEALGRMSSVVGLANPNIGQAIAGPMIESGELLQLADEVARPFYRDKLAAARGWIAEEFGDDFPYRVHRSEGALFLWLWFPGLPCDSRELYRRLKERGVLVVPGDYFFFGLEGEDGWRHRHECLRVSAAMEAETVREGIRAIAAELRELHGVSAGARG